MHTVKGNTHNTQKHTTTHNNTQQHIQQQHTTTHSNTYKNTHTHLRDELHDVSGSGHTTTGQHLLVTVECVHLRKVRIADADYNDTHGRFRGSHQCSLCREMKVDGQKERDEYST